mmetsp:Transcript_15007/g.32487  ORF Transcript_15007/g.32487 Transcript_15007/m.32487 type:complete len:326 (-) Transcript_15007:532-1509(-)
MLQYIIGVWIVVFLARTDSRGVGGIVARTLPDGVSFLGISHVFVILRAIIIIVVTVVSCLSSRIHKPMPPNHMCRNSTITLGIQLIQHHKEQIKTTQQRVRQSNVLLNPPLAIILPIHGVSSRQYRTPSIQTGMKPSLGNRHSLLFHGFVNRHTVVLPHLIKLIHAHQSTIGQHHGPGLQPPFLRFRVTRHCRSQTHTTTSLTSSTHSQGCNAHGTPQQLTLGRTRITNHQYVNISPQMCPIGQILLTSTQQLQRQSLLNHLMSMNRRTHAPPKNIQNILPLSQRTNRPNIIRGKHQPVRIPSQNLDIIHQNHSLEHSARRTLPL